jgi:proteasome lid subunit RPN8/RPN11
MPTTVPTLVLPPALFRQIETEGEAGYPNEICGMMFGRDARDAAAGGPARRLVERLVVGKNAFEADEQYHRFSIDPREQMRAERAMEAEGLTLLGYYHSHPDAPARPSEYDREHAWEFYSYVIVAVAEGKAADMTSWVLDGETKQFARQEIERA